jgi:3-isopropylmalate/(R)-2-methylmalate dehydratase large subunit
MTISQKIIAAKCGRDEVVPGEIVQVEPDLVMLYDWPGFDGLMKTINIDPDRVALNIDHYFSPPNEQIAKMHRNFRNTVGKYGIKKFFDIGKTGIGFQLYAEEGLIRPGMLVAHADPHVSTLSAFGAYCVGIGSDVISIFMTGKTWLKVPETLRVHLTGTLPENVTSRDVFEQLVADIGPSGAIGQVVEFTGPGVAAMSMESRMVLCNSVQYLSAETAIIAPDDVTTAYLKGKTQEPWNPVFGDENAPYAKTIAYDLSTLEPLVVTPPDVYYVKPVGEVSGKKIHQAIIGTCAGGRMEDLRIAAKLLKGKSVAPGVRFMITPITPSILAQASKEGLIEVLVEAGALVGPPSCGPCYGGLSQLLAGEVCISTGTLNIPGRLGSKEAEIYMANPAVVTASAIKGEITDPRTL